MGITIHHRLSLQKVNVKNTLDRTEKLATDIRELSKSVAIPINIRRESDYALYIDIGGCETLSFDFKSVKEIMAEKETGWSYLYETLTDGGKKPIDEGYEITKYPQNEIYYCSSFCKTQYAKSILEHKWVAELIRSVAGYCLTAEVSDEGDYYHSGNLNDAVEAIESLGVMITNLGQKLGGMGFELAKGGDTKIKSLRKK